MEMGKEMGEICSERGKEMGKCAQKWGCRGRIPLVLHTQVEGDGWNWQGGRNSSYRGPVGRRAPNFWLDLRLPLLHPLPGAMR